MTLFEVIMRLLVSVPGSDRAEDYGFEPLSSQIGWKELDMLGKLIDAIQDSSDVEYAVDQLIGDEPEDE